jgi:hypothetical protein
MITRLVNLLNIYRLGEFNKHPIRLLRRLKKIVHFAAECIIFVCFVEYESQNNQQLFP